MWLNFVKDKKAAGNSMAPIKDLEKLKTLPLSKLDSIFLRWFDHWLKNKPVNWEKQPKVRVFVTGVNEWREMSDWPETSAPEMTLYLSSEGRANGAASAGALVDRPQKNQMPDRYT